MTDARFEDGGDAPLRLLAQDADSLDVISALLQDAVLTVGDMRYDRKRRRFGLLLSRFRWEDVPQAERAGRAYERVRALLMIEDVLAAQSHTLDISKKSSALDLLSIRFFPDSGDGGRLRITFAGGAEIVLTVEVIEVSLNDVTRPHTAASGHKPSHSDT